MIVTHRLNTVRRICDRFILIDRVEGSGGTIHAVADSFEELAEVSPAFRSSLWIRGLNWETQQGRPREENEDCPAMTPA